MSLKHKTIHGVAWAGLSTLAVTVLNFIINAFLARLLSPHDFGLMGIVLVVTGLAMIMADLGLGASVVQSHDISERQLSTFFYLNVLVGALLSVICYAFSGAAASFFDYSELTGLLKTVSVSFLIVSFSQVARSLLQKKIEFKTLFTIDILSSLVYGVSSIAMALNGFGVKSLVYGFLIKQLAVSVLAWFLAPFRPSKPARLRETRELLHFGLYVFGEKFLNYFNRNLDNILIGKFLGPEALGYYTLAYNLMLIPVYKIAGVVSQVAFPAFSAVQTDIDRIRRGYVKMIQHIALLTFPIMGILFVAAPEFMMAVYGPRWMPVVPVLQILCAVGAAHSIGTTIGSVLYARGRSDLAFKMNLFAIGYNGLAFALGLRWGLTGVAACYALATLSSMPIEPYLLRRLIGLDYKSFFKSMALPFTGTLLTIVVLLALKQSQLLGPPTLVGMIAIGSAIYICFMYWTDRESIVEGVRWMAPKNRSTDSPAD